MSRKRLHGDVILQEGQRRKPNTEEAASAQSYQCLAKEVCKHISDGEINQEVIIKETHNSQY